MVSHGAWGGFPGWGFPTLRGKLPRPLLTSAEGICWLASGWLGLALPGFTGLGLALLALAWLGLAYLCYSRMSARTFVGICLGC